MITKTTLNNEVNQETFPIEQSIKQLAREMIKKHPGIYYGNLEFWIKDKLPKATKLDIKLAVVKLMFDEGYFISFEYTVHPPGKFDEKVRTLTKFISRENLSFTDYGILYELYRAKKPFNRLSDFSLRVAGQGWSEDEREVKVRIQELVLKKIIIENHGSLQVNWKLIQEAVQ